ncbi:hypothetical protein ERJ75_000025700 [Trypanosoma vivax]|nr:hypothetical protein ERJ75_000025700 [Trypanosoma vivax]
MSSARTVVRTAESEAKRRGRKKGGGGRLRCGDGSACATARGDKGQGWSYILSLWCLLDSLAECEVGGRIQPGGRACNVNSGCGHDTSRGEVTVSEKLVDSWMGAFDAGDVPSILCGGGTGSGCGGGHQTARRAVPPLEFRECVEGSDALRRWHTEAKEGFVSELLTVKPFHPLLQGIFCSR